MFGRTNNSHLVLAARRLKEMETALAALKRFGRKTPSSGGAKRLVAELNRRRVQFERSTKHMKDHIGAAEARLKKLNVASAASWSAFQTALGKSQRAFAKANRKAGKAIKHAMR